MKRRFLRGAALLAALLLACSTALATSGLTSGDTPTSIPNATPTPSPKPEKPTQTPKPTATPKPTQAPSATPTAAPAATPKGGTLIQTKEPTESVAVDEKPTQTYTLGTHKVAVPQDWLLGQDAEGRPEFRFVDGDGRNGVCTVSIYRVTKGKGSATLETVGEKLGAENGEIIPLGKRDILVYELVVGERTYSAAMFLQGLDALVTRVWIEGPEDPQGQRTIALRIAGAVDTK